MPAPLSPACAAQPAWAALPLADRIARVQAGITALNAMKDEVVQELAGQMAAHPLWRRIRRRE